MDDFLIKIASQGGHGCNREAVEGETFHACGKLDCPDCFAAELVAIFNRRFPVHFATFTHWPVELNQPPLVRQYTEAVEIVDDIHFQTNGHFSNLLRKRLKGSFRGSR